MKKIVVESVMLILLMGCSEKQIVPPDPVALASSQLAIAKYIEKNNNATEYIIQIYSVIEKIEYNTLLSMYNIKEFRDKILRNILNEEMTEIEKREIILLTELIFSLVVQQYKTRWKYPVEPDYLKQIKVFFQYAAETAKLYEVKNATKNDVG